MFKRIIKWSKKRVRCFCSHDYRYQISPDELYAYLHCIRCGKQTKWVRLYGERPKPPYEHIYRK